MVPPYLLLSYNLIKKGGSYKEPLVPVKIRDDAYQVVFNSKMGENKGTPDLYGHSYVITSVTSTTVFIYATSSTSYYFPINASVGVIFCTPTTNTITSIINTSAVVQSSRTVTLVSAPSPAFTTSSIAVFVNRNNPPTVNMCLSTVTSSIIPLISSTNVSSITIGDTVQFGNDVIIPLATVTAIAGDLLSITIDGTRTVPANTILTIYKETATPVEIFRNNMNYQMDWGLLEKRAKYKCTFGMEIFSNGYSASSFIMPIQVFMNMGANTHTYEAGNPNISSNLKGSSSQFIGCVNSFSNIITQTILKTDSRQNSSFFLPTAPSSNSVNISLIGNTATNYFNQNIYNKLYWTDSIGCNDYVLTLLLERLPDDTLPFYNIIFNSRFASGTTATLANTFTQNFDWSVLPESRYKCSFSSITTVTMNPNTTNLTTGTQLINMLYTNIPLSKTFEAGSEDAVNKPSNQFCIGLFYNYILGFGFQYWTTLMTQNFPFIISRPQNPNVTFRMLTSWDKSLNVLTGSLFPHSLICMRMEQLADK